MSDGRGKDIGERKKKILRAVIDEYIAYAEPVGSKVISERSELGLSAATIRNEMADLEALGFLDQPHTSSGRVPSHAGYRLYVDELMKKDGLTDSEADELGNTMRARLVELDHLIANAAKMISELTKYAALSLAPHITGDVIRKIELFSCGEGLYVFVMVSAGGLVNDRLIRTSAEVDKTSVAALAAALNEILVGISPCDITLKQVTTMEARAGSARELLAAILDYIKETMSEYTKNELRVDGAVNLLYYPEFKNLDKARELLEFLDDTGDGRWAAPRADSSMDIRIGRENHVKQLEDSSLIVADVKLAGSRRGYIGIIGPTRMDYARVAARLRYVADMLGYMLGGGK